MIVAAVILGVILGAALGSFACCQAWRLRYRAEGERGVRNKDGGQKQARQVRGLGQRSVCMSCRRRLKWYDNIPIVSWVMLGGRCRYCRKKIGAAEILAEVGCALAYGGVMGVMAKEVLECTGVVGRGGVGDGWPVDLGLVPWWMWAVDAVILVAGVGLALLAVYDAKWGEMPTSILTFVNVCAIIVVILRWQAGLLVGFEGWANLVGAVGVLAGVYYLLYIVSKEKWVGGGDWILGLAIGLILGNVWLAMLELLVANVVTLVVAGVMEMRNGELVGGRGKRKGGGAMRMEVPLGPGLVVGFAIVLIFGDALIGMLS